MICKVYPMVCETGNIEGVKWQWLAVFAKSDAEGKGDSCEIEKHDKRSGQRDYLKNF